MNRTGMDSYTAAHFHKVARQMNNYVAASAYNFYPEYDRAPMGGYQSMLNSYGNLAYHIGEMFNGYL
jgi:hypothetical protein